MIPRFLLFFSFSLHIFLFFLSPLFLFFPKWHRLIFFNIYIPGIRYRNMPCTSSKLKNCSGPLNMAELWAAATTKNVSNMAADLSTAAALRSPENGPNMVAAALTETGVRRTTTLENGKIAAGRLCQLCHTGESSRRNSDSCFSWGCFICFSLGLYDLGVGWRGGYHQLFLTYYFLVRHTGTDY